MMVTRLAAQGLAAVPARGTARADPSRREPGRLGSRAVEGPVRQARACVRHDGGAVETLAGGWNHAGFGGNTWPGGRVCVLGRGSTKEQCG
jgi:hypothetical protein